MHLKSLTVRGFKSFASATTFDFEPGVTAVVGPNGSGKSNVVDALAWVMGEQGAKTLRGGKMEDVIFAGTSGRPPLGRAHVSSTIDNADDALPIEYSEVTISRTLFRTGGSEYAINGAGCRLLDIQELLSDSGLGREMHVIVGQGQLDRVLHATPEDRRGFIEEAAGILKHRRRKEKTVRKLEAMQANLARLSDLTGEIRRQLTPLGKQAEVARRAQTVQFDVRDARARLLADDLVQLQSTLDQDVADESRAQSPPRRRRGRNLSSAGSGRPAWSSSPPKPRRKLNAARDNWYQLSAGRERLRSLGSLAEERRRLLGASDAVPGYRPRPRTARPAGRPGPCGTGRAGTRRSCEQPQRPGAATAAKQEAENARRRRGQAPHVPAPGRRRPPRRPGQTCRARWAPPAPGWSGRRRNSAGSGNPSRPVRNGAARPRASSPPSNPRWPALRTARKRLDADYEDASDALDAVVTEIDELKAAERDGERERDALMARRDALQLGLNRKDGSDHVLGAGIPGVLGSLASMITVEPGFEAAIAAALGSCLRRRGGAGRRRRGRRGPAAEGRRRRPGRAAARRGRHRRRQLPARTPSAELPGDARWAVAARHGSGPRRTASGLPLSGLLAGHRRRRRAGRRGATDRGAPGPDRRDHDPGDVFTALTVSGGSAKAPSLIEVQAAVDDASARLAAVTAELERQRFALAAAQATRAAAQDRADAALERLHDSDARLAAVAERLGHLNSVLRSAVGESERLAASLARAEANIVSEQEALAAVAATAGRRPGSTGRGGTVPGTA